jgi:triosephosphate isomerase
MRKKIVAGNWKMNMDLAEGLKFVGSIDKYFKEKPSGKALVRVIMDHVAHSQII